VDVKENDMKKPFVTAALVAVALSPMSAFAQDAAAPAAASAAPAVTPTVGAKVYDPQGAEVGSIEKVDAAGAVVFTGTKRATLPASAFAKNDKGLLISMTQTQLNAAVAAAEAKTTSAMDTKLAAGAAIKSKDGVSVGSVKSIAGDNVTIALSDGNPVTVTKQYLTVGADGNLALTMNSAEFKSAVSAASQSAATAPAGADAKAGTQAQTAETPDASATGN
jgi:preprotein translocase subunit YajC